MTTQHTPGPWKARPSDTNPARVWITQDAPPNTKAVPFIAQCAEGNPQAEANARLIANAPELLAALERLYKMGEWQRTINDEMGATVGHAYSAARAAIAKATGAPVQPSTFNLQPCPA